MLAFSASTSEAQYSLQQATGPSGIIVNEGQGAISYEVSTSRIAFNWGKQRLGPYRGTDEEGFPLMQDWYRLELDVGFSALDGERDLFAGGRFNPGGDGAVTYSYTREKRRQRRNIPGYHLFFTRLGGDVVQNKIVLASDDPVPVIKTENRAGASMYFSGGYNNSFNKENAVFALSGAFGVAVNSRRGLSDSTVCTQVLAGVDDDGNPVTAASCDARLIGGLSDGWIAQVRGDLTWNLFAIGRNRDPNDEHYSPLSTVGLLASLSGDFSQDDRPSMNVALGPTLHPPGHPHAVVFATLFELVDATNSLGNSPSFQDRFRVRVYVGVPFDVITPP